MLHSFICQRTPADEYGLTLTPADTNVMSGLDLLHRAEIFANSTKSTSKIQVEISEHWVLLFASMCLPGDVNVDVMTVQQHVTASVEVNPAAFDNVTLQNMSYWNFSPVTPWLHSYMVCFFTH